MSKERFESVPDQTIIITPEFAEQVFAEIINPDYSYDVFRMEESNLMSVTNPHLATFCEELFARKIKTGSEQEAHQLYSGILFAHRVIRKAADNSGVSMPVAPDDKMLAFQDANRAHPHGVQPPMPDFVMPKNAGLQAAYDKLSNDSSRNGFIILTSFFETFLKTDQNEL